MPREQSSSEIQEEEVEPRSFAKLAATVSLDVRLRKAVARLGHVQPTPVQSLAWEHTLVHGRDVLIKAPTGSGKTVAYAVPLLQRILSSSTDRDNERNADGKLEDSIQALVLVPTKELCHQVASVLRQLSYYCDETITVGVISSRDDDKVQAAALRDRPNVIVATPSALVATKSVHATLSTGLETMVIDEADLVLSFGYKDDVTQICQLLPKIYQGMLVSATLSPDVNALKQIVLHSPVVINVKQEKSASGKLKQFFVELPRNDKCLLLYVFLKLGLLRGKGLFFVRSTDAGYRLKLVFEQFFVRTAVLNAELPLRSRLNIIEQFNLGSFDYLIATDASTDQPSTMNDNDGDEEEDTGSVKPSGQPSQKPKRSRHHDSDFGVSRGVDFLNVSFVVNVDMPATPKDYAHRIGRTARGGTRGVALTLVEPHEHEELEAIQESQPRIPLPKASTETLQASVAATSSGIEPSASDQPQPVLLDFNLQEIEGFRYRVEDVSRGVTKKRIREARVEEIRAEILHSERLRVSAPNLQALAQPQSVVRLQDHLKHIPDYLLPQGMQVANLKRNRKKRKRNATKRRGTNDPLQSFNGDVTLEGLEDGPAEGDEEQVETSRVPAPNKPSAASGSFGKSTSGRRAWKERHKKGEFSKKKRLVDRKYKEPLGI